MNTRTLSVLIRTGICTGAACLALHVGAAAQSFVNFESSVVHPIRVSDDGTRLFVVNPQDNRLAVYGLADASDPVLLRDIPVGLEPVSVTPRTNDEVWVVNNLSDSISIVSVSAGRVIATLRVKDEPADVAFAGTPERAFVTAAASDEVYVFDATSRAFVQTLPIFGKDPKALAVHGSSVYVLVQRSGNGTTVVPESLAPPPPPPTDAALPAPPQTSLIVAADDPAWFPSVIPFTLPDNDLYEFHADTLATVRVVPDLGTIHFDLAVHDTSGEVFVANTDARNLVRFENELRGHAVDSRVTVVGPGASPVVTAIDLNPGIDYTILPNAAGKSVALAEPTGLVLDSANDLVYVAAHGTDRVAVLDTAGTILARIEIGSSPGATVDTRNKRGPRALALHPTAPRLYVYNRLSHSITIVDTVTRTVLSERPLSGDPNDAGVALGRRFLYDAKLSGNGTQSCASCHIDGDMDGISWDLGLTDGQMDPAPIQPFPFNLGLTQFHPMKGPMFTQSLRGLDALDPFHWRGEKLDLASFNSGFSGILAGDPLSQADLDLFVEWMGATAFPPNPNRNLDDTLRSEPAGANQAAGFTAYVQNVGSIGSCATCHSLPSGSNSMVIGANLLQEAQQMKVPQLRNMYRKLGMQEGPGASKSGFGYIHDGSLPNLLAFLTQPVFNPWPNDTKDDLVEFMLAFPTGMAPAVGYQVTVDSTNVLDADVQADIQLLESQALAGNIDLVAKGTLDGLPRGLLYDPDLATWSGDESGVGPFTTRQLRNQVLAGDAVWTATGTPPGTGLRIGLDRDDDGQLDGDDGVTLGPINDTGCGPATLLDANMEPRVGTPGFALVLSGAPPSSTGEIAVFPAPEAIVVGGLVLLRIPPSPLPLPGASFSSDANGFAVASLPIPADASLAGRTFLARAVFDRGCGRGDLSNVVTLTIQP